MLVLFLYNLNQGLPPYGQPRLKFLVLFLRLPTSDMGFLFLDSSGAQTTLHEKKTLSIGEMYCPRTYQVLELSFNGGKVRILSPCPRLGSWRAKRVSGSSDTDHGWLGCGPSPSLCPVQSSTLSPPGPVWTLLLTPEPTGRLSCPFSCLVTFTPVPHIVRILKSLFIRTHRESLFMRLKQMSSF